MPEQTEQFNLRKKIEVIELELKKISSEILELTLLNKLLHEDRKHNATEIDVLKSDMQTAKGAISLLKGAVILMPIKKEPLLAINLKEPLMTNPS